ncbi:hypothetical protein P280DRAFT_553459 [Massarina eburnea CBS 473.64]|uniref:Cupredoxin n=1 Tax=Massarina eburnea CBS 473.64 TaxID=1395130 RepID=A0A6A6RL50_9PLEO|nr:hypothetical protein P280DRAFT_553459 [Massarina eburnea CBS 473.64]
MLFQALCLIGTAFAAVHNVEVGKSGLTFDPSTLNPAVGDTVVFKLYPQHNVVSGPFASPCQPGNNGTFFSGPFSETNNGTKKFVVNVTTTDAVYYYCAVGAHCPSGMVGGWNIPTSGNNIESYRAAAASVTHASTPSALAGGQLLDDSQLASITANASSSGASGSSTPTSTGSPTSSGSPSQTSNAAMPTGVPGAMALGLGVAALIL